MLDIPAVHVPTTGEMATLLCSIIPPDRFVLQLTTILWSYDMMGTKRVDIINADATLGPLVEDHNGNYSRNITLDPVKTSDARRYYCSYAIGVISDENFTDLTIQSK